MRRRSSGRQQAGIALFPFLAVLLCTMGCLIVLLLLVVQQARVGAKAAAAAASAQRDEQSAQRRQELEEKTEDLRWQNDMVADQVEKRRKTLAAKRLEMSALEENIRKLEEEAKRLAAMGKEVLQGAKPNRDPDQELADLKRKLDAAKEDLEAARKRTNEKPPEFAIVPYEGPNGTTRRPIFIECDETGVYLQPEGIDLNLNDFRGPMGPGNPLDAVLRAAREHMKENGLAGEPYPLIIVRPSGAMAFLAARQAMKHWDNEYGYELVEDEVTLKFPKPDPALKSVARKALQDARDRQAAMMAAMPGRFQGNSNTVDFRAPPMEDAAGGAGGSGAGTKSGLGGKSGSGSGTGTGTGVARAGYGLPANGKSGAGSDGKANVAASAAYASAASKLRQGESLAGGGLGGAGWGSGEGDGGDGASGGSPSMMRDPRLAKGDGRQRGGGTGSGTGPGGASGSGSGAGGTATKTRPVGTAGKNASGVDRDDFGQGDSPVGSSVAGNRARAADSSRQVEGGGSGQGPGGSNAKGSANARAGNGSSRIAGKGDAAGAAAGGAANAAGASGGTTGQAMAKGGASGGSAAGAPSSGSGTPIPDISMQQGAPPEYKPNVTKAEEVAKQMTRRHGEGWGMRRGGTRMADHATAIKRPVRVEVARYKVSILPEPGDGRRPLPVQLDGEMADSVQPLLEAVWRRMDQWGAPVEGCYWKPVLSIDVKPDAQERLEELTALLEGSGVDVQRRVKR